MVRCLLIIASLAFLVLAVTAQSLGRNYGIDLRVNQKGLDYATQQGVDEFYNDFRNKRIEEVSGKDGRTSYRVWNIKVPTLSRPSFTLKVNQGRGLTARLSIANFKVTGNFWVQWKMGWIKFSKSGTFSTSGSVTITTSFGIGADSTGRPTTTVQSCNSQLSSFTADIDAGGITGAIIRMLRGRITKYIKGKIQPMLCEQIRKLNGDKVQTMLRKLEVSKELQDPRLRLDYSLLRAPQFGANFLDATFKADVAWKGQKTNTPIGIRSWPTLPGSKMVNIYMTSYVMNALGQLMHKDGQLTYNVTRDQVKEKIRPQLSLSCDGQGLCAGIVLPELAEQYPDGWMEAGLRTSKPPVLTFQNDVVLADFQGILEAYVRRPNGNKIRVASVEARLKIPLSLRISGAKLLANLGTPQISVDNVQAQTQGLERVLDLITAGFTSVQLDKIGQRGIDLPAMDDITLVGPQVTVKDSLIIISSDIRYEN